MNKKTTRTIWLAAALIILISGGGLVWAKRHDLQRSVERASLPTALPYQMPSATPTAAASKKPAAPVATKPSPLTTLPPQANLAVPFTVQAPRANWDEVHEEFCEEASIVMAMSYINNQDISNPDVADQKMQSIKTFEEKRFGYYKDTTIEEVAIIFRELYHYNNVRVLENPTSNDIRQAVGSGKLVLVPAAGQELGNPYFQAPGPLYHMFVVKGYTADGKFIVNDPGTRRGADYLYGEDILMNAIHNWPGNAHIDEGEKVVLIVG